MCLCVQEQRLQVSPNSKLFVLLLTLAPSDTLQQEMATLKVQLESLTQVSAYGCVRACFLCALFCCHGDAITY